MTDEPVPPSRLERALRWLEETAGAQGRPGRVQDAIRSLREAIAVKQGEVNLARVEQEVMGLESQANVTWQHIDILTDRILKGLI